MFNKIGGLTAEVIEDNWRLVKKNGKKKSGIVFFVEEYGMFVIASITDVIIRILNESEFSHSILILLCWTLNV